MINALFKILSPSFSRRWAWSKSVSRARENDSRAVVRLERPRNSCASRRIRDPHDNQGPNHRSRDCQVICSFASFFLVATKRLDKSLYPSVGLLIGYFSAFQERHWFCPIGQEACSDHLFVLLTVCPYLVRVQLKVPLPIICTLIRKFCLSIIVAIEGLFSRFPLSQFLIVSSLIDQFDSFDSGISVACFGFDTSSANFR